MESVCLFLSVRVWGQGFDEGKADNWPLVDQPKRKNKTIKTQRIFFFHPCVSCCMKRDGTSYKYFGVPSFLIN